ncbi:DUF1284 domain-containing protein [Candidatus Bathyarchaeota archaeon]|nr:MAG: DUF1284 domain-containing protein [Candidatus Bathyarchaeota archaeon]
MGGCDEPLAGKETVIEVLNRIRENPEANIRLECDVEPKYYQELLKENKPFSQGKDLRLKKLDLDVLQILGLIPNSSRPAWYLYKLLLDRVETVKGICSFESESKSIWWSCPNAQRGFYEKARKAGIKLFIKTRSREGMRKAKEESVAEIYSAERLYIRPHHLMCIVCFYGRGGSKPLEQDNLYEVLKRTQEDPDVPITLVEGCDMICPPCPGYNPETHLCDVVCGLIRDYKKDLDVLQKLDLTPGATLKARNLYKLLFERIPSAMDICGYGDGIERSYEWAICGNVHAKYYEKGRKKGIFKELSENSK